MLFNSIEFALFLPVVFVVYWFVTAHKLKFQNLLIVISSFIFYGWWDWRFLFLLVFSASVDYVVGLGLAKQQQLKKRKLLLLVSVSVNLGLLGFFKYYNFFVESFADAFTFMGRELAKSSLKIVLPVGISFYTFQALSYSIDVYRRQLEPTKDLIAYFAFISFFPQLVAGPIERATHLLPHFYTLRTFEYAKAIDGLRQILWGLFKKMVIADNCATIVNQIFDNSVEYSGSTLFLGAILFAFQIYGDFSGYSDIAIGTARLFGFSLMRNFAYPYFSRDIAEFWRRWHISLSTWFRDYVYIPLGGSQGGTWMKVRNTVIIFLLSGFWHGANWTFIAWGFIHALYFIPLLIFKKNRVNTNTVADGKSLPSLKELAQIASTFLLTTLAWVFFRSPNIYDAFKYIGKIFSGSILTIPELEKKQIIFVPFIILLVAMEWLQRDKQHALQLESPRFPRIVKWTIYYGLVFIIIFYAGSQQEFIYFQF